MSMGYDKGWIYDEALKAKINDMLARIASLEDQVRELNYLIDEIQKRIEV